MKTLLPRSLFYCFTFFFPKYTGNSSLLQALSFTVHVAFLFWVFMVCACCTHVETPSCITCNLIVSLAMSGLSSRIISCSRALCFLHLILCSFFMARTMLCTLWGSFLICWGKCIYCFGKKIMHAYYEGKSDTEKYQISKNSLKYHCAEKLAPDILLHVLPVISLHTHI